MGEDTIWYVQENKIKDSVRFSEWTNLTMNVGSYKAVAGVMNRDNEYRFGTK